MNKNICIISGPTATGKTSLSVEVAKKFEAEIVNFDSLVFYKELNIGSAKPTIDEMQGVTHHLVGSHLISNPINAADFSRLALPIVNEILSRGKNVVLVGGSGFYLQALVNGMYESKTTPKEIMDKSEKLYNSSGIQEFLEILKVNDKKSFERYHENDHYRIRRAVEHFWTTGESFSSSRENMQQDGPESPWVKYGWSLFHVYLDIPKPEHFEIIQKRTENMINSGLIDEVKHILEDGHTGLEKPLSSIGYKETVDFLNANLSDLDELKEKISIATRQLAKSQRTWFKKQDKNSYNPLTDKQRIIEDLMSFFK